MAYEPVLDELDSVFGLPQGLHFDRDGEPITLRQWAMLREAHDYAIIAQEYVGEAWVSTVWIGLDMGFFGGAPVIFETMIFGGEHDQSQYRYMTEESAERGHRRVVEALEQGRDPNEEEDE